MANQLINKFTAYEMTEDEIKASTQLSPFTRMWLQNELSYAAEQKVALKYDPQNPMSFVQQEAELQGKIGLLEYILATTSLLTQEI